MTANPLCTHFAQHRFRSQHSPNVEDGSMQHIIRSHCALDPIRCSPSSSVLQRPRSLLHLRPHNPSRPSTHHLGTVRLRSTSKLHGGRLHLWWHYCSCLDTRGSSGLYSRSQTRRPGLPVQSALGADVARDVLCCRSVFVMVSVHHRHSPAACSP